MCLLLFKPADKEIPYSYLKNSAISNPHGSGIAIADGERLIIQKSATWGAEEIQTALDKFKGHPAIVHFRYATHGGKNYQNTHPFWLNDKWCAAHNGVITIPTHKDESDTRAFLRVHVKPLVKDNVSLADTDIMQLLGEEMGSWNKMVYLSAEGAVGIANEESGHWNNGIWYSNHNYEDFSTYYDYTGDYDFGPARYRKSCGSMGSTHPYSMVPYGGNGEDGNTPCSGKHAVGSYPPEDGIDTNITETWHRFDTKKITCDACEKTIEGPFKIGAETGLTICEMCEFFGADEKLVNGD